MCRSTLVEILRAADQIRSHMGHTMQPYGLSGQQYNVLRILDGADAASLPILEIAARMIERTPGITRFVDQLEAKGYISRERDILDRRKVLCSITESGRARLKEMDQAVVSANLKVFAPLSHEELADLHRYLATIMNEEQ